MQALHIMLQRQIIFGLAALFCIGCDFTPRSADLTWNKPVQITNGETVEVKRHVMMLHERQLGGGTSAPIFESSTIDLTGSAEFPTWNAPMVPIVLDKDPGMGEWIVVAGIDGCSVWSRNGRPRPPYWAFRLRGGEWYRDTIPESFIGRPANLLVEFDVTEDAKTIENEIGLRKKSQIANPKHAAQYHAIDWSYRRLCDQGASEPIGNNERDLKGFKTLK
jgi:hypothetical protein